MIGKWPWSHRLRPLVSVVVRTALLQYEGCYVLRHLLHQQTFTPNDVYNRRPLLHTRNHITKKPLHQKPSTPKAVRTEELLHQKHFTPNDFYNRMRVHQEPYTPKELYTRKRLTRRTLFTPENLYVYNTFTPENPIYTAEILSNRFSAAFLSYHLLQHSIYCISSCCCWGWWSSMEQLLLSVGKTSKLRTTMMEARNLQSPIPGIKTGHVVLTYQRHPCNPNNPPHPSPSSEPWQLQANELRRQAFCWRLQVFLVGTKQITSFF